MTNYQIETRDMEPFAAAYLSYQGPISEAPRLFPEVFKSIRGKANGAPFINYLAMDPETKKGKVELCVPTAETPSGNGIQLKQLPRIRAICTTHTGPYDTLTDAYAAIDCYAAEQNLRLVPPFREVYIKGPGMLFKGNPHTYITEIQFPIEEDKREHN